MPSWTISSADDFVLAVEEDHPELLVGQAPHGGAAVVHQGAEGGDLGPGQDFFLQIIFGAGLHQADEHRGIFLQAGDFHKGCGRGVEDPGEGAEMGDQVFGQGLDVGVGDGKGEQQLQQLVILQGPGPALEKALPEALPVAVIVGLFRFWAIFLSFTPVLANCNCEKARADTRSAPGKSSSFIK